MKKIIYPIEAFALAMVLFSSGLKDAALVGITLIFADILSCVVYESSKEKNGKMMAVICAIVTVIVMSMMFTFAGRKVNTQCMIGFVLLAILEYKHMKDNFEVSEFDYDSVLFVDSIAFASFIVLAIIREYCSTGKIFEIGLHKAWFVSSGFANPMIILVLVGCAIACINKFFNAKEAKNADLWVCLPIIVLQTPIILKNALDADGKFLGIVISVLLYMTYRNKVDGLNLPSWMKGLPIQLILLGIIFAVAAML